MTLIAQEIEMESASLFSGQTVRGEERNAIGEYKGKNVQESLDTSVAPAWPNSDKLYTKQLVHAFF